jgi:hypothetical protein
VAGEDQSKLIRLVEKRLEFCLTAKDDRIEEAMVVLMAYSGFSIDKSREYASSHAHNTTLPHWFKDKVVLNVLQPIARTAASIITSNNPSWVVEPMGDSAEKYQAARGVSKLLDYFYRSNNIAALLDDVTLRAVLTGYAGLFVDWDSQIGRGDFSDTAEGREGWFVVEPVDIFNLHFEPGVGGIYNAHWCIKESTMNIEAARLYFNDASIGFEKEDGEKGGGTVKRQLGVVTDMEGANSDVADDTGRVRVLHYWQKPGINHPKGIEVIIAGDTVVSVQDELLMGEFPVYMMRFITEPHRDYGSGLGPTLLQMQRDLTMTWNGYRARRDQEIRPPWMVPAGSTTRGINTYPGAINELNPRAPAPTPLKFDPMSQVVGAFSDKTLGMMEYIAGINDVSRGETPTSNATGRLTAFLAELDNRKLGPTVRSMGEMLSHVGKRMIRLWQRFGADSVTVTVLGRGHAAEVSEIRREDILWNDIDIDIASLMPKQQPLRQETILNLIQMGVISQDQALDALEFGGFDEAMGIRSTEALSARAQNEDLADISIKEEDVAVIEQEDHDTHIREHGKFLVMEHPGTLIRKRFERHIRKHKDAKFNAQLEEIQLQQALQAASQPQQTPQAPGPGGSPLMAIAGAGASPGGIPPEMVNMAEPGVDRAEEAALASMAGIE